MFSRSSSGFSFLVLVLDLVFSAARLFASEEIPGRGKAQHVVIVVCDGMRPDFISAEHTPALFRLMQSGVFFRQHHSTYPSSTNVNGAVLATGDYPVRNGIVSNQEYRPEIDPLRPFDTSDFAALDAIDGQISAKFIAVPTVAEIVQQSGSQTAIAGSKPIAQLMDRSRKRESDAAKKSLVVYRGKVLPATAQPIIDATIGPFPIRKNFPNEKEDAWTTRALTDVLWKENVPKFSLLWLSEPDLSQHETAPGSRTSLAATKNSDNNLAKVLTALKAKNALTTTDLFVVSDHGFSTIDLAVNVAQRLRGAGFNAVRAFNGKPQTGQVLVVTLGGSVAFYVVDHDEKIIARLLNFLQRSDFAGVILTRAGLRGTFTLEQAHLNSPSAPDVMVSCRWNDRPNEFGVSGEIASDVGRNLGHGSHSTFSPHDLASTLVASGPDFRDGWSDDLPSGNIDVAPTILWILGLKPPQPMDGRILVEALRESKAGAAPMRSEQLEAHRDLGNGTTWRQTLRLATVGKVSYFVEGKGGPVPKKP